VLRQQEKKKEQNTTQYKLCSACGKETHDQVQLPGWRLDLPMQGQAKRKAKKKTKNLHK